MYCSRTLTPSGGRVEQLRGGALGAMVRTKKVLTRAEAKAMALRDGVEQVVLTQDVDDMQRVANERKERAEEARRRLGYICCDRLRVAVHAPQKTGQAVRVVHAMTTGNKGGQYQSRSPRL